MAALDRWKEALDQHGERALLVPISVLPLRRPNLRRIFLEWIDVDHPVKNDRIKSPTRGVASLSRRDRTAQTKLRSRAQYVCLLVSRSLAEIHMLVPLRDAQRNALIQIVFGETFWCGVHRADQLV